ncbi:hypothetical protein KB562_04745 [Pasteurella atlantica]|uniref:ESPR-type extended signal peptide-containing protein n=1 Tax=Pasteurellaceae TaxID=712 RepID=UPI001B838D00|nr:ESPR-type extended signal peptide-containing protein [Pasteurella atlantica]MBR0573513.1 hypothetical protein [Pasteurella atlantica]MDP8039514.1 ESPR-type extended signal peptide-containing protein [Pasteurella atlantica]MDP8041605.1 ESPR-type extended signal peptide-containing protein [Pasteurella atlantica]MDP8045761.1 ESPR-type extended signal peptide-containing protein [Pasteurella atlantica]MDP8181012.1 ESPR-type extended signal peptide-containing protein [Pasteurella atlantica]
MNKTYKIIYCTTRQTWIAVSELAKGYSKGSSHCTQVDSKTLHTSLKILSVAIMLAISGKVIAATTGTTLENASTDESNGIAIGSKTGGTLAEAKGPGSIAIGSDAKAKQKSTMAIGLEAIAEEELAFAIGWKAKADKKQSLAIGSKETWAKGEQAIAIGGDTYAMGDSSIAIGGDDLNGVARKNYNGSLWNDSLGNFDKWNSTDVAKKYKQKTGKWLVDPTNRNTLYIKTTSQGAGTIAVGVQSYAGGDLASALGTRARAGGFAATAFGIGSEATKDNSVALGAGSITSLADPTVRKSDGTLKFKNIVINNPGGTTTSLTADQAKTEDEKYYSAIRTPSAKVGKLDSSGNFIPGQFIEYTGFAGGKSMGEGDQVSVGARNYERQIKHVAAGQITPESTDAVNGSQLFAITNSLQNQTQKPITFKADTNSDTGTDGSQQKLGSEFSILTNEALTDTNYVGDNLTTEVKDGKVLIGMKKAPDFQSIKLTDGTNETNLTTTTDGLNVGGDKITNVADGTIDDTSKDVVNGSQLFDTNNQVAGNTAALGGGASYNSATNTYTKPTYNTVNAAGTNVGTAADNVGSALTNLNNYINSGFNVQERGTTKGTVTPTESINFVNGTLTTARVIAEANGVTNITFDVDAQSIAQTAQLPVVYTKEDGTKVYKKPNGKFSENADLSGAEIDSADVIASMQNADGTTNNPSTLANVKSTIGHNNGEGAINQADAKAVTNNLLTKTDGLSTASTVGDLQALAQAGLDFAGDDGTAIHKALGQKLEIIGGATTADLTDNNIGVNEDAGKLKVQLSKNLKGLSSTQFVNNGGTETIKIDGNTRKITGLLDTIATPTNPKVGTAPTGNQSGIVATVKDILNTGWNLQVGGNAKDFVQAYDTVNFENGTGTTVEVNTTPDGKKSTIKVNLDAQGLTEKAQLPVVYTKEDGTKVYKKPNGKFSENADLSGAEIDSADVIASMQNADGTTNNPSTLANVKSTIGHNNGEGAINQADAKAVTNNLLTKTDGLSTASTVGDLQALAQAGLDFAGDDGTAIHKALGQKLEIIGGATTADLTDNNIGVNEDAGKLKVQLSKNLKGLSSTQFVNNGGTETIKIDGNTRKITGLLDTIATPTNPKVGTAPTGNQSGIVATVKDILNTGWNLQVGGNAKDFVQAYDTVNFKGKNGITVEYKPDNGINNIEIGLTAGTINNNATTGAATGNTGFVTGTQVATAINNAGHTVQTTNTNNVVTGNTGSSLIKNGQALTVEAGKNLSASMDSNGTLKVSTKEKVQFTEVTIGNTTNNTVLTSTNKGLDVGGDRITNIKSGLDGRNILDIKKEGTRAAQWSNAATIGDLATVQGNVNTNVTNISNINKIVGGTDADGNATNAKGDEITDTDGNPIKNTVALTTYDADGQTTVVNNSTISAINNMNEQGIKFFHTHDGKNKGKGTSQNPIDSVASGKYSTGIGYQAKAKGENAIAFGKGSQATAKDSIAVGTGNIVDAKH